MSETLAIGDALRIDVPECPPRVLNDLRFSRHARIVAMPITADGMKWVTIGWPDGWQVGVSMDVAMKMRQKALNGMNTTAPELPERPAYFGMVYDGNKLEAHDVNIVHDLRLTPKERAYIDGALDMAIYNIMQLRRAENNKAKVGGVSEFLAMDTDRTETFIVIEPIKHEADDEA